MRPLVYVTVIDILYKSFLSFEESIKKREFWWDLFINWILFIFLRQALIGLFIGIYIILNLLFGYDCITFLNLISYLTIGFFNLLFPNIWDTKCNFYIIK